MKSKGTMALAAAGVALAAWLLWAFRPQPVPVELGTVERGPLIVTIDEDARTRVVDRFVVHAPLAGELERIGVKAGDAVAEGDVLARIVPRAVPLLDPREREQAQAAIAAARASLEAARARTRRAEADMQLASQDLARLRPLVAAGQASESSLDAAVAGERARAADLDSARFGERVAAFELQQAQAALSRGRAAPEPIEVRSPVAALVLRVPEESGGPVEAGQHLIELGDPSRLEVVVDLLSADAVTVAEGARVILEGWGGAPLEGRVRRVEPAAVTKVSALGVEEQRVDVIVDLVSSADAWHGLGDGYALDARVVTWEASDVLVVPSSALFRTGNGWSAFVVRDGRAQQVAVDAGHRTGLRTEVVAGLAVGDRVVVHPGDAVQAGVRVRERG